MDSILNSIKKLIGMDPEYTQFDTDLIIYINSIFAILKQVGVGPENGFSISDDSAIWDEYLPDYDKNFEFVKTYIQQRVKLVFDPPLTSSVLDAMKETIKELEWRLNIAGETYNE